MTTKVQPQIIWAQPSAPGVRTPEPGLPRTWWSRRGRDFSAVNDTAKPSLCVTVASHVITLNPIMITSFYNMLWPWDQYIKRAECQLRSGQDSGGRGSARPRPLGQPGPACPGGGRGEGIVHPGKRLPLRDQGLELPTVSPFNFGARPAAPPASAPHVTHGVLRGTHRALLRPLVGGQRGTRPPDAPVPHASHACGSLGLGGRLLGPQARVQPPPGQSTPTQPGAPLESPRRQVGSAPRISGGL